MREHVIERDVVLAAAAEVRHELAERRVEGQHPLAHEGQRERGGRELRERREVEQRIGGAGRIRSGALVGAQRAGGQNLALAAALDPHDARGAQRADRGFDDGARRRGETAQPKSRKPAPSA